MKQFINHPMDIPIGYSFEEVVHHPTDFIHDIHEGGLSFRSRTYIEPGSELHVRIPIKEPVFEATGTVAWCREEGGCFLTGVHFSDPGTEFQLRMTEQVCYIEHYKKEVAEKEHRILTDEQASIEWIRKYAKDFPQ